MESFRQKSRTKWIAGIVALIIAVVCLMVQRFGRTPSTSEAQVDPGGAGIATGSPRQAEREQREKEREAFKKMEREIEEQARRNMAKAAANPPVSIFSASGRVTPDLIEKLKLSESDVQALQKVGIDLKKSGVEDLKQRLKLTSEGENEEGKTYSYHARASRDRGKGLQDEFWEQTKGIFDRENPGSTVFRINPGDYVGYLGQYDTKIDVFTKGGVVTVKFQYVDPETGGNRSSGEMPMADFSSRYGEIVQISE